MEDFANFDYYQLLDVTPTASADEIKRAYRRQIARYHPDRYVGRSPDEQQYAGARAQRINEAYRVLGDASARRSYDRGLLPDAPRRPATPRPAAAAGAPAAPRDHQAELYARAEAHLAAGRYLQAAATLRELQRLNPFYRDSAALLARAEAAMQSPPPPAAPSDPATFARRRTWILGGIGGLALVALGLLAGNLWLRQDETASAGQIGQLVASPPALTAVPPTAPAAGFQPATASAAPTAPAVTATALPATSIARPTAPPPTATAPPTAVPPTVTPLPTATVAPTATPPVPSSDSGALRLADDFSDGLRWATVAGRGWSVGYDGNAYQVEVDAGSGNIWSFNTAPGGPDFSVGVDVRVNGEAAGLLVRYQDRSNYLAFLVNPQTQSYRLEQHRGGQVQILAAGESVAINSSTDIFNRLVARLDGSQISLFVNGAFIEQVTFAGSAESRLYGMIAVARTATTVATFDNLSVRDLP